MTNEPRSAGWKNAAGYVNRRNKSCLCTSGDQTSGAICVAHCILRCLFASLLQVRIHLFIHRRPLAAQNGPGERQQQPAEDLAMEEADPLPLDALDNEVMLGAKQPWPQEVAGPAQLARWLDLEHGCRRVHTQAAWQFEAKLDLRVDRQPALDPQQKAVPFGIAGKIPQYVPRPLRAGGYFD